ncbi:DUF58 domain-containing protein [Aromatoleum sp.]|uniref:DUF58 domain-containing protein n=1 Tax=Aromatoleum sp. TaxID=2307007 RepID=UPI002FC6699D
MNSAWSRWFAPATAPVDVASAPAVPSLAELVALRRRLAGGAGQRLDVALPPAVPPAPGMHCAREPGRGMEFAELRPYQRGDDVRSIDWRHTAKRGRPYTKVFHAERERPMLLLIDRQPSMRFGTRVAFKSVLAARAAALLAWSAAEAGDSVGGVVCDATGYRVVPPRSRQRGAFELMRALATDGAHRATRSTGAAAAAHDSDRGRRATGTARPAASPATLCDALRALQRTARAGGAVVVFSDFRTLDADAQTALAALAGRGSLALVHVFDPLEAEPPPPDVYRIADAAGERVIDLHSIAVRAAYGDRFRERRSALAALARRLHASLIPLSTADDPIRVLQALGSPRFPQPARASPSRTGPA